MSDSLYDRYRGILGTMTFVAEHGKAIKAVIHAAIAAGVALVAHATFDTIVQRLVHDPSMRP